MTIRFSKGGKWYKLGDKVDGTNKSLYFSSWRNGQHNVWSHPIYDPATGSLNPGDGVQGMYLGGVLHPFITLDNSGTRGALVAPVTLALDESRIGDWNIARKSVINENVVFKKISATQWQSEKSVAELNMTVVAGTAPTGKINLTYMNITNSLIPEMYRGWGWRGETSDMAIMKLLHDPFVTHVSDLTTYLIKVIA